MLLGTNVLSTRRPHSGEQMTHPDYAYSDYSVPDPPHQPMYLRNIVKLLRRSGTIRHVLDAGCGDGDFTQSRNLST